MTVLRRKKSVLTILHLKSYNFLRFQSIFIVKHVSESLVKDLFLQLKLFFEIKIGLKITKLWLCKEEKCRKFGARAALLITNTDKTLFFFRPILFSVTVSETRAHYLYFAVFEIKIGRKIRK